VIEPISVRDFEQSSGVDDWRIVGSDGACATFRTASFAESVQFVQAIGELPGLDTKQPGIDIRPGGVTVQLITATAEHFGLSRQDLDLAARISTLALDLGLFADPAAAQSVLVIPGALDVAAVMPFWQAMLGYDRRPDSPDEDLIDPHQRGPGFWFEQMEEPRADGGGAIHLAIWVPYEEAEARIAAALAAGGHMVRDDFAPAWWTLADAAGNEADIATTRNRG
jgi:4a-hydroxytetrahydrobiopterin dehydratase